MEGLAPHHAIVKMQPIAACFHNVRNVNTYVYQNLIPNLLLNLASYIFSFLTLFIFFSLFKLSMFTETLDAFYLH